MKRLLILAAAALFPAAAVADSLQDARTAALWYHSSLKASTAKALREKGTAAAMESCSHEADQITKELLAASRLSLRLTSRKIRNPANTPTPAESEILTKLEQAHLVGKLPVELVEKVMEKGKERVVYVKPVLIEEQCLACHGRFIPRGISDIIRRKYGIEDDARGYQLGELRGIISITLPQR